MLLLSTIRNGNVPAAFHILRMVLHQIKVLLGSGIPRGQLTVFLLPQKQTSPLAQFKATKSGWARRRVFALLPQPSACLPWYKGIS